jgi:L-histidine N-alpha-methyltransferase
LFSNIARDTLQGLSSNPKYLLPRYFYDDRGSQIFQEIMKMPEYYLTDCEVEIFFDQKDKIACAIAERNATVDIIEFGCGDGFKTKIILEHLVKNGMQFNFMPIDISAHAVDNLVENMKEALPGLSVQAKIGDYFYMMEEINRSSTNRKIILFLGANIGNYSPDEAERFLHKIENLTEKGDKLLIGFDLIKSPEIIYNAYSDPHGHTKNFNLNHLERLNVELGARFDLDKFEHHTVYNPMDGSVKSYLVSVQKQTVHIESLKRDIHFAPWEPIFMELSQKYNPTNIEQLARKHGFKVLQNFRDNRNYFVDSLWLKIV